VDGGSGHGASIQPFQFATHNPAATHIPPAIVPIVTGSPSSAEDGGRDRREREKDRHAPCLAIGTLASLLD
jgi:hypothetical protein